MSNDVSKEMLDRRATPGEALPPPRSSLPGLAIGNLLVFAVVPAWLFGAFSSELMRAWSTVFVATTVQAVPFLVLGSVVSGAIAAFMSPTALARLLPRRQVLAVPAAGLAGALLPGCECASVPITARLLLRGVTPAAAFTFLLAAPAINPVVLVATAVAFPDAPEMVGARLVASLTVAVVVGWIWIACGRADLVQLRRPSNHRTTASWRTFALEAQHDFLQAAGFLTIGAAAAATLNVMAPRDLLEPVATNRWLSILVLAVLAVGLAICSEADAFVAASLSQFSPTAQLAFMVVGPVVDLKLIAMQSGVLGRRFAVRFAPLTFVVAVGVSVVVGSWLL